MGREAPRRSGADSVNAADQIARFVRGDIDPGLHYCHRCERVTAWTWGRGRRFQRCESCSARFPCSRATCEHTDCTAFRASGVT